MSVFGGIVYGGGQYGPGEPIESIDVLSRTLIRLTFGVAVVLDSNYYDISNYTIAVTQGTGDVNLRRVLQVTKGLTTTEALLVVDTLTPGTTYQISMAGGVTTRTGTDILGSAEFIARTTKADSALRSIPNHFDKRPESLLAAFLNASAKQDEAIGGSRNDTLSTANISAAALTGPSLTLTFTIPGVISAGSQPAGTYEDATEITIFVDAAYAGSAILDPGGTWTFTVPGSFLTIGVPVTITARAFGPTGYTETSEVVTPA